MSSGTATGLIESIKAKPQSARLRSLMPSIIRKIDEGASYQQIVDVLNAEDGFNLTVPVFKVYLYRYRKKLRERPESGVLEVPKSTADGNLLPHGNLETTDISPSIENSPKASLDEILHARNKGTLGDEYLNRKPQLFGKNKGKK